jgi:hypothetical protein
MHSSVTFRDFCQNYFFRLCRGYVLALDDTSVRAWLRGVKRESDEGGEWVLSSRMFPAIAAWLSVPSRPRTISFRSMSLPLEALALATLNNAFDPSHPGFWGRDEHPPVDQRVVESAMIAYGVWLGRDALLPRTSPSATANLQAWLDRFGSGPLITERDVIPAVWNLMWIVNHTARQALGWPHDRAIIDEAWSRIERLHRGDGWMSERPGTHLDDYNWWGFGAHELFCLQMAASGAAAPARAADRIRQRLGLFPFFFGRDGSYPEFGRSLSYKFGRLGCALLAYKLGFWPHSPGLLKRIVRRHLEHYDRIGGIDRATDIVLQSISEFGTLDAADFYISTGHPYWCMQAFTALWQLDEGDPIWAATEEPLPVETSDFRRTIAPAGWILQGTLKSGQVQRYSVGTAKSGAFAARYGKFAYCTHFPPNFGSVEGDFPPDSALTVTDGDQWSHPCAYREFLVGDEFLRGRYVLSIDDRDVEVDTTLVPIGDDGCIRVHRVRIAQDAGDLRLVEGGCALGYTAGELPRRVIDRSAGYTFARLGDRVSLIWGVRGYTRPRLAAGFRHREDLNAVHARALTPMLEVDLRNETRSLLLVCVVIATIGAIPAELDPPTVEELDGDRLDLRTGNRRIHIPGLPRP